MHFPLISKAKLPAIRTALDDLPSLWKESDGFWNWIEAKAPPRKAAKRRSTGAQTFGATMDDGAIVLGIIELGTKTVTLSVNSEARAARGRAMLEPVLAGLARAPLVERQSIEQMMASSREHSEQDIVRLPPDEERSIVHQALTDHFRKTLDEPNPALGGQTPREAVKTAKGRIAWLKMLENKSAQERSEDPGCGENSALATSGGDRIEAGRSAMRKGSASGAAHGERAPVSWAKTAPRPRLPPRRSPPT